MHWHFVNRLLGGVTPNEKKLVREWAEDFLPLRVVVAKGLKRSCWRLRFVVFKVMKISE